MSNAPTPWVLYIVGAVIALLLVIFESAAVGICPRYVHSAGIKHTFNFWRIHCMVRFNTHKERKVEQCTFPARHFDRFRFHRRRCVVRCLQCIFKNSLTSNGRSDMQAGITKSGRDQQRRDSRFSDVCIAVRYALWDSMRGKEE